MSFLGKCAFFFFFKANIPEFIPLNACGFFLEEKSCVPFSMCSHCSKYSGAITGSRAKTSLNGTSQHCLSVPGLNVAELSHLLSNDCQKPLITSLCLSSQITKQYPHYASGGAEPKHFAPSGMCHLLTGSRSLRGEQGWPPTQG